MTRIQSFRSVPFLLFFLSSFILPNATPAAFSLSGQNEARYGAGLQPNRFPDNRLRYLENYLELTGDLDKFRFYLRQSYRLPSEYGIRTEGLDAFDKMYIEYRTDNVNLRGGDFYRTWGRGLLFGNQEIRDVNIDTGIEGVLVEGNYKGTDAALFKGVEADTLGGFLESAEGFWISQRVPIVGRLGLSYINIDTTLRHPQIDRAGYEFERDFEIGSVYAAYTTDRLPVGFEQYADYRLTSKTRFRHLFFTATTFYGDGWSVYLDYRNYRALIFWEYKPIIGDLSQLILQNPPIGRPENTLYLLDHYPRYIRYENDVGYQVELSANRWNWDFLANYHLSSRADNTGLFTRMQDEFAPYEGLFLKAETAFANDNRLGIKGGWQRDAEFDFGALSKRSKRVALGTNYELSVSGNISLFTEAEVMQVRSEALGFPDNYYEQYLSATASWDKGYSLTLTMSRSESPQYQLDGVSWGKDFIGGTGWYWPSAVGVVQIFERHQLRLFWGYERGGISCAGGVCHQVNPFKGVKFSLVSSF